MIKIQFLSAILSVLVLCGIAADLGLGCLFQAELESIEICCEKDCEQENQNPSKKTAEIQDVKYRPEDVLPRLAAGTLRGALHRRSMLADAGLLSSLTSLPTPTPPPKQA